MEKKTLYRNKNFRRKMSLRYNVGGNAGKISTKCENESYPESLLKPSSNHCRRRGLRPL